MFGRIDSTLVPEQFAIADMSELSIGLLSASSFGSAPVTRSYAQLLDGLIRSRHEPFSGSKSASIFVNFHFPQGESARRNTDPTGTSTSTTRVDVSGSAFPRDAQLMPSPMTRTPSGTDLAMASPTARRMSRARTAGMTPSQFLPSCVLALPHTCDALDPEANMRTMDRLYNATFYEFIRSEDNLMTIARHLLLLLKEYDLKSVANALRWVISGWRLEGVAKLLKLLTRDWLADMSGILINLVTVGWRAEDTVSVAGSKTTRIWCRARLQSELAKLTAVAAAPSGENGGTDRPSSNACLKLVAIMIAGEPADITATFVKALTSTDNWSPERVTELVSFLDAVLEWDEVYFRDFTRHYVELSANEVPKVEEEQSGTSKSGICANDGASNRALKSGKLSFDYLAALYKTNLALANYKLALADFKLALASRGIQGPSILAGDPSFNGEDSSSNLDPQVGEEGSNYAVVSAPTVRDVTRPHMVEEELDTMDRPQTDEETRSRTHLLSREALQ